MLVQIEPLRSIGFDNHARALEDADLPRLTEAPIAAEAVKRIDVLFAIEREINGLAAQERLRVRQERSRPLIVELEVWLREQRAKRRVARAA